METKELKGYYTEEELVELHQNGKITWVEYVEHHDPEMTRDYHSYCKVEKLDPTKDDSAKKYLEHIETML